MHTQGGFGYDWPGTHYVEQADFKLTVFLLPQSPGVSGMSYNSQVFFKTSENNGYLSREEWVLWSWGRTWSDAHLELLPEPRYRLRNESCYTTPAEPPGGGHTREGPITRPSPQDLDDTVVTQAISPIPSCFPSQNAIWS